MNNYMFLILIFLFSLEAKASDKDSTVNYNLPDSVKVVLFMAEIKVTAVTAKQFSVGISATSGALDISEHKGFRNITFETDRFSQIIAVGNGVYANKNIKGTYFILNYNWELNKSYKLLIAIAGDSAANFYLSSAYIFFPDENKWKFLGTSRHYGNTTLKNPHVYFYSSKKGSAQYNVGDVWCQRQDGSWKNMKDENLPEPAINLFGHIDSVQQHQTDIKMIEEAIASGKTDAKNNEQGVYYTVMKEGTGRQVTVNDTVSVFYKLTLLNDGSQVSEKKEKPDTFPLKRLIKGWQIGVPLCKVGGKIKLVIPSDLAYSIRTRSANIPPNSILVFEIEVLDAKSP